MKRQEALYYANKLFGGFGVVSRVPRHGVFVYLVGKRRSDGRLHMIAAGKTWDESILRARQYERKLRAQMELAI